MPWLPDSLEELPELSEDLMIDRRTGISDKPIAGPPAAVHELVDRIERESAAQAARAQPPMTEERRIFVSQTIARARQSLERELSRSPPSPESRAAEEVLQAAEAILAEVDPRSSEQRDVDSSHEKELGA